MSNNAAANLPTLTLSFSPLSDDPCNQAELFMRRVLFFEEYCNDKGWDKNNLEIKQIMDIREQDGWIDPVPEVTILPEV